MGASGKGQGRKSASSAPTRQHERSETDLPRSNRNRYQRDRRYTLHRCRYVGQAAGYRTTEFTMTKEERASALWDFQDKHVRRTRKRFVVVVEAGSLVAHRIHRRPAVVVGGNSHPALAEDLHDSTQKTRHFQSAQKQPECGESTDLEEGSIGPAAEGNLAVGHRNNPCS